MKTLYLFATSERPDAYINAFAYGVDHLGISSIYVIVIAENDGTQNNVSETLASSVVGTISEQLKALSEGNYVEYAHGSNSKRTIPLQNTLNTDIYRRCLQTMNQVGGTWKVIHLADLDQSLKNFVSIGECIFDVSALKKNLLVDVVATLLSLGFTGVYNFELRKKQTFGQADLYNNLVHNTDYTFHALAESTSVKSSLKRIERWSASVRFISICTFLIFAVFVGASAYLRESEWVTAFNVTAGVASIASYLYLFNRHSA